MNDPNMHSRIEESRSGTLHTSTHTDRVEKRDTETIQMDTTTEHATPSSSPKKSKKLKTEETPKVRERTRSKTRHFAVP
jgi:hypothetical protein